MSQLATILDIARMARVSPSTVSRALRKETSHLVRADKMKRIQEVMDQVSYSPSRLARGLRNNQTKTINLVVSYSPTSFQTEIVPRLISGITEVLVESGYDLKLCMQRASSSQMELREHFTDADGIIYASHQLTGEDMNLLKTRAQNCVVVEDCVPVDWPIQKCGFSTVGVTNEEGARELVQHLIELGHNRIGFVKGLEDSRDAEERFRGYRRAMKEYSLPVEERWIIAGNYQESSGREALRHIRQNLKELTACMFASDDMAIGALDEAVSMKLRIPDDFSIAGYDNVRLSRFCTPKLTTVDQPREKIGNTAARCLLNQIQSEQHKALHLKIPHALHVRGSTGLAANS